MKRILSLLAVTILTQASAASPVQAAKPQVIEIQKGDLLPLEFTMAGSLIETEQLTQITLRAKEHLWLRVSSSVVEASLDGRTFEPFSEFATGSLEVGSQNSSSMTLRLTFDAK